MNTVPARADVTRLLEAAALASLRAPSVFNTQPWRWRIVGDTLELSADPGRGLAATDSDGRLLVINRPVPEDLLGELRHRVEAEGAFLHVVRPDQVMTLAVAADRAAAAEHDDPAYAAELRAWSNRPAGSGDGVPAATARGLATEPLSESAEVAWGRTMLRGLLAGIGEPYLAVRLGYPDSPEPPPAAPRREPAEVIIIDGPRP